MNDDVVGKPRAAVSRTVWRRLATVALLLFFAWAIAGFFMDGEDALPSSVPWLIVFGGGIAEGRIDVACQLYSEGHGREGVVLSGGRSTRFGRDRAFLQGRCAVPSALLHEWPNSTDTFEELSAVASLLSEHPGAHAIVVSDSLHMPRLRYVRDRLALNGLVYLRQSRLDSPSDPGYLLRIAVFWFREPLAYIYNGLRFCF